MKTPLCLITADWHLRTTSPCSRAEKNWFTVMENRMLALKQLQRQYGDCPILIAGDLFNTHDSPASLITWAMRHMPNKVYSCPGNHDLLGHSYAEAYRGSYGALVESDTIKDMPAGRWFPIVHKTKRFLVWPMPWGFNDLPESLDIEVPDAPVKLCLLHKYVWASPNTKHFGAGDDSNVVGLSDYSKHFDLIAIGDNHISWKAGKFHNPGGFFSFTSAEKTHIHFISILYSDGSSERVPFPEDAQWVDSGTEFAPTGASRGLLDELNQLDNDGASFETMLKVLEDKADGEVKRVLTEVRSEVFGRDRG